MRTMRDSSLNSGRVQRIAVVGGGITGLSAAWALRREAAARGIALQIELYESGDAAGGVLRTTHASGLVMEHGPDCFISTKPAALELCRELGLEDELIATRSEARQSFILFRGRLEPIPKGFFLLAPTSIRALLQTPLLSWAGKLRASLDWVIPGERHLPDHDESLSSFVRRRFGDEVLDRIAQPMVGGIYTADPEQLSLAATFPQFLDMEAKHGSVIRALVAQGTGKTTHGSVQGAKDASGPRYGLFVSLRGGMQRLVLHLQESLAGVSIHTGTIVTDIVPTGLGYRVEVGGKHAQSDGSFDGVVVACPAHAAARLFSSVQSTNLPLHNLTRELSAIGYASCAIANLVYRRNQVLHPMNGAGFVVPHIEGRKILAASFSHAKWPNRADDSTALIRVFMGGAVQGDICELPEADIVRIAMAEIESILGISGPPLDSNIKVWKRAMPQYAVGHKARVGRIRAIEAHLSGLALAGNAYEGVGIPDCIASSNRAATKILRDLE
jgi:oxygen-dependent protoporphyrinogen oxidase